MPKKTAASSVKADDSSVKVEDIKNTQPVALEPDELAKREQATFDHNFRTQQAELGWIGKLIGSNSEKPGNISFIVIIISLFFVGIALITKCDNFERLVTVFCSIVTLALGYLFGSTRSEK